MATIGQALSKLKLSLIFVGDSLTGQLHASAQCSLERFGWKKKGQLTKQVEIHGVCSTGYGNLQLSTYADPTGKIFRVGFCRVTETKAFEKDGELEKLFDHADMVVFNWGLWEHDKANYKRHLQSIFKSFGNIVRSRRNDKLPIFRETTAQHFFSRSGTGEYEDTIREGFASCWGSDMKTAGDGEMVWWFN